MKKLNFAKESAVRDLENESLNKVMDLWHRRIQEKLDRDMDILVGNRRKHPALGAFKGLSTQVTVGKLADRAHLVVWYDPYEILYAEMLEEMGYGDELVNTLGPMLESGLDLGDAYEPADHLEKLDWDAIIRRIGLWILRAEGFVKVANRQEKYAELDNLINTECRTPPLNNLLKKVGYDFESGLNAVVDDTLEGMKAMDSEPPRRMDRAVNALRLWNLLKVCSAEDRMRMEDLLNERFHRIGASVEKIDEIAGNHDLLTPVGNRAFTLAFIKENRLPGEWEAVDEIQEMLKTI